MVFAPIFIPTLCRSTHFVRLIESLKKCSGASETELFIGIDYPTKETHWKGHDEICEYCKSIEGFKSVHVFVREENLGPVKNAMDLKNKIQAQGYDRYISTEDDNEFAPNALEYLSQGLERYKDDHRVMAICSSPHPDYCLKELKDYRKNCYCIQGYLSWGNGFWFNRREEYQKFPSGEEIVFSYKMSIGLMMKKKYQTLHRLLFRYKTSSGDLRLNAYCSLRNKYCIFPVVPKVRNWGFDGSGLNCAVINSYEKRILDQEKHFVMDELELTTLDCVQRLHDKYYGKGLMVRLSGIFEYFMFRLTGKRFTDIQFTKKIMKNHAKSMNV